VRSVHGRFMEQDMAIILVCGFLNLIPWFLLLYQRPDLDIADKVADIDTGLAQIAQILFERLDNLEEMGSALPSAQENPLLMILNQIMSRQNEQNVYGRNLDGTFNGAPEIIEAESSQNDSN
jgi:hypothetical protein